MTFSKDSYHVDLASPARFSVWNPLNSYFKDNYRDAVVFALFLGAKVGR